MPFKSDARWSAAASPADLTVCARTSIVATHTGSVESSQIMAVCDADLGYSELNAQIAGAMAGALRTALSALHNPSSPTVQMRMAVEHALRTARRHRTRLTGYVPPAGMETDGLSVMAAAGFGERLIVVSIGACRLWIWRAGLLCPLTQQSGAELVISERAFLPGDRVLLASVVMADVLSDAQIATMCHRWPHEPLLANELVRRGDAAGLVGLMACAVMTRELSPGQAPAPQPVARHPVVVAPQAPVRHPAPGRAIVRRVTPVTRVTSPDSARDIRRVSDASLSMLGLMAVSCVTLAATIMLLVLTQQSARTVTAATQSQAVPATATAARSPQGGVLQLPATPTVGPSATAERSQVLDALSIKSATSAPATAPAATRALATPTAIRRMTSTPAHTATVTASPTAVHIADALPTLTAEPFATAIPVSQP